ncbi:MAG: hypothetical protein J5930_07325 [Treponema sp.]|nr:hypothetical protein [Treponema sp.]
MTDFEKVKNYYRHFDEKNRLQNDNSGKLEFLMTMRILEKKLPHLQKTEEAEGADGAEGVEGAVLNEVSILDLGGGAGAYSFPLAKKGGKIFASFIPHLSSSISLVQRFCWSPDQVDINTLEECFESGRFRNLSDKGFQEGFYPASEEIENLFSANGFEKILLRSIRGFGYEKEDVIFKFKNKNVFSKILDLIDSTAEEKSIIEMCGHAMYVGRKSVLPVI